MAVPCVTEPAAGIELVAGDILLFGMEDELSSQRSDGLDGKPRAFRVLSARQRLPRRTATASASSSSISTVSSQPMQASVMLCP